MADTLHDARQAIAERRVLVAGAPSDNAGRRVAPDESLAVRPVAGRFVSRGGEKLAAAIEQFELDLVGRRVLDAGASTGGFTDAALQAGAAVVVAVDVGRGQLHQSLRDDPRVELHERTNIRDVQPGDVGDAVQALVADLSFISLRTVAPPLVSLAVPGADLVWLVKPQFEASRPEVSAGRGVIRDPEIWSRVLTEVGGTLADLGATIMGIMMSPLRGADGNVEFLLHALTPGSGRAAGSDLTDLVDAAVAGAGRR